MKIIVLLKQVPDPDGRVFIKEDGTIDRARSKSVINPYDKNALEAAIALKEKHGAEVTAVSMGPPKAMDALREALAIGADDAVLLSDKKFAGSDTWSTSYGLARAIEKLGSYDLILCGVEATDGNTGQVGPEVAEHLGVPQATYVDWFEIKGESIEVRRVLEDGYERLRMRSPALLSISSTANEPRMSTFSGIIKALAEEIPVWTASDIEADESRIGLAGSPTKIRRIKRALAQRDKYVIQGESLEEIVDNLVERLESDGVRLKE